MLKFIPVRGRKRSADTPRAEGRQLKFIPVRGRKLFFDVHKLIIHVEIYPREGTETRRACHVLVKPR